MQLADGAKIAYRIDGPSNKPVVVLSNSLMSTLAMWEPQMGVLTPHFRVLRYDTRGHGDSDTTPGPYTISMLADDVVAMLDALGIEKAHFVGLSKGGMIGQQFGARHGGRALSLSLCDTASEMPPRSMWEERFEIARRDGIEGLVDGTIKRWFTADFIERAPQEVDKVRSMIRRTGVDGYIACASAVRDMNQTAILSSIRVPTLIIVGESDPACTVAQSQVLHREIPGSQLTIIPRAAHLANIEQPDLFNDALIGFLLDVDSRGA